MSHRHRGSSPGRLLVLGSLLLLAAPTGADPYRDVLAVAQAAQREAVRSQERIDGLARETRGLADEYRAITRQADSLRVYTDQLASLVAAQRDERVLLQQQIDGVTRVEREIMPLMSRMIDTLTAFVEADVPFLLDERRRRVERLRDLLLRADVTVGEKYRRLIEAFQIESDYGHSLEAYQGTLEIDGEERELQFLRIGRVALFYQTPDGKRSGTWNGTGFEPIDSRHGAELRRALRVARRQAPPGLLMLPVATPATAIVPPAPGSP